MPSQNAQPRLVIAGTQSGAGKTTVSVGLMAAFARRGLVVQGFKTGPDFIDPSYHTAVTGRPARNLDGFMCSEEVVREIFLRGSQDADLSIIEGVMGLYDGKSPLSEVGSTAEMGKWLKAPVILCVDVSSMARSAAAVVLGYQKLDPAVQIAGVITNRVGSQRHYHLVKAAIEQECQVPVLGYLPSTTTLAMPERHLGLIPAIERGDIRDLLNRLTDQMEATVDLDGLLQLAVTASVLVKSGKGIFALPAPDINGLVDRERVTIAVAKDAAFNFYYPENLELLESNGARLRYFSPLAGEKIPPDASGLYIGGGFPEEFAAVLSQQTVLLEDFRFQIMDRKLPTFAECGGYMFLCKAVTTQDGKEYPMVGVLPAVVRMQTRLAALGYREVAAIRDTILLEQGEQARGHEFHYSTLEFDAGFAHEDHAGYQTEVFGGADFDGIATDNLLAGYTHLHFASNPRMAGRFVGTCREFKEQVRLRGEWT